MLPIQILLNNLLYDFSESTIPTDNVDESYISTPKKWDMGFIQKFIVVFGPISSVFDFITFGILLLIFNANVALFQTSWFIESICTQTLVIFVIRTRTTPFLEKPVKPAPCGKHPFYRADCLCPAVYTGWEALWLCPSSTHILCRACSSGSRIYSHC